MKFSLSMPREILFGRGVSRRAPEVALRFGRRVFLVTGARSVEKTGLLDAFGGATRWAVSGEPDVAMVDEGARRCREAACDVVVGVGGGSALDGAKAVSALAVNGGSALDYLEEVGTGRAIERPPLPFIAVPTTAGSGSEATRNAVLRAPHAQVKRSIRHDSLMPRAAIVDPDLSAAAPPAVAASAGLDALTHLLEAYVSTGAQPTTDALALPGIRLAARGLRGGDPEAMALAALWGGMALANAGLGAVHGLVAPLGGRCAVPHGIGCACLLVETVRANIEALRARAPESPALGRYAEAAAALGGSDVVDELAALRRELGVPALSSFGFRESDIPGAVAGSRAGSMKYNPIALTDEELAGILRKSI